MTENEETKLVRHVYPLEVPATADEIMGVMAEAMEDRATAGFIGDDAFQEINMTLGQASRAGADGTRNRRMVFVIYWDERQTGEPDARGGTMYAMETTDSMDVVADLYSDRDSGND